jgi:serine/threonine protein kinase
MRDRIGHHVGNYRLTRLLGTGGFAEVYLGEHLHLEKQAAIKLLHTPLAVEDEMEQFRREAQTIARLNHPQILHVLDFGVEAEQPYLVLDYAPGGSLRQRHPPRTPVPLPTVLHYVRQVAGALAYAHEQQPPVIHRDIKPQNLLLGKKGQVLLGDFGISVVAETTSRQRTYEFAGTVAYAAPEQMAGHPVPASDQYALGVMVYEWLTGTLPFSGPVLEVMWKHTNLPPPPLREKPPTLSAEVETVVLIALAKDPKERFGSVQAFAHAFALACQKDPLLREASGFPPPPEDEQETGVFEPDPTVHVSKNLANGTPKVPTALSKRKPLDDDEPTQTTPDSSGVTEKDRNPPPPSFPPPRETHAHKRRTLRQRQLSLLVAVCLVVLALVVGGVASGFFSASGISPPASAATVTITPTSSDLKNTYTLSAVTGTPDASRQQVGARLISATTSPHSQTVPATGSLTMSATTATGVMRFSASAQGGISSPAGTTFTGKSGVTVITDAPVDIPVGANTGVDVPAHAINPGSAGNLPLRDIDVCYLKTPQGICLSGVFNRAFTGGQDAGTFPLVLQSDINEAANSLITSNQPDAQQVVLGQARANEQLVGTPQCSPTVSANQKAGDRASQVMVTVTFTCTGEVYDRDEALALAKQLLTDQASRTPGAGYTLVGQIKAQLTDATLGGQGTVTITVTAEGVWVYHFTEALKQTLATLVAGKSKQEATASLQAEPGVAQVSIQLASQTEQLLPTDPKQITITIQTVPGV